VNRRIVAVLALASLVALSCATRTELSGIWVAPSAASQPLQRVLVIGVASTDSRRRTFEDGFVAALAAKSVVAAPSYEFVPNSENLTKETIGQAITGKGFDGVIVTRLLTVDEEKNYIPPSTYVVPTYRGAGLYNYYPMAYDVVHTPGRVVTKTIVRLETHVYEAANAELVWAAHSDTFDPDTTDDIISSVTSKLSDRLAKDGVLGGGSS
jgi:hypothetical protein